MTLVIRRNGPHRHTRPPLKASVRNCPNKKKEVKNKDTYSKQQAKGTLRIPLTSQVRLVCHLAHPNSPKYKRRSYSQTSMGILEYETGLTSKKDS